jgi:hypothetical protein
VLNKSIKIIINWVIGPVLAAWLFYSLYQQIKGQEGLSAALQLIKEAPFGEQAWKFWLVIALAFVNWGIESRKWQLLMKLLQPMRFSTAVKSVLCGVTLSLNTPNRIGEYGGRVLFVEEGKRIQSVSLSIAGSISQLIITIVMGCGGLLYLLLQMNESSVIMGLSLFWVRMTLYLSCCVALVLLLFFFKLGWLIRLIDKLPYAEKFSKYISVLEAFDAKLLLRLLFLSLLRYLVFVLQYIFMLQLTHVGVGWWQSFWIVSVLFLVLAIVPSFAIADLGIRGKFGVELLKLYSGNVAGIIGTTFGIWFINLFVPAILGSLLILGKKIIKEK